jgi:hypothetical protein
MCAWSLWGCIYQLHATRCNQHRNVHNAWSFWGCTYQLHATRCNQHRNVHNLSDIFVRLRARTHTVAGFGASIQLVLAPRRKSTFLMSLAVLLALHDESTSGPCSRGVTDEERHSCCCWPLRANWHASSLARTLSPTATSAATITHAQ